MEIKLYLKDGTYKTLSKLIMDPSATLPTCVTLTLYPLGKATNKGYGKRVMLCSRDILKVMWLEGHVSSIHKSDLFLKHLHDSFPNSIEEVQTMKPAKSVDGPLERFEFILDTSFSFFLWNC